MRTNRDLKFFIGGEWVDPHGKKCLVVENPATEDAITSISLGTEEDVNNAVESANTAFEEFSNWTVQERISLLRKIRVVFENRAPDMARVITAELGAPIDLSKNAQVPVGLGHLDGILAALEHLKFKEDLPNGDQILREPIGPCGLITPWNWPVNQIALKVIAALAAGCTMVLKPSEITPLSAMLYADILDEAGVPPGVFNLVNGEGPQVGEALSRHRDIAMISFTGSTRAGVAVTKSASTTVKRVTLELGGKSPNIVFEDSDVPQAVKECVDLCFMNSGQSCNAPTRLLVQSSVYVQAIAVAKEVASAYSVGNPEEPGDHLGPLVSRTQFERVQKLIDTGIKEGARLLVGGVGRPKHMNAGHFVRPTVFADVDNKMAISREEVFGPVLCILPFEAEQDAIDIANDTAYGLAAYVQTGSPNRAARVSQKLKSGMVHINGTDLDYGSPFGGYKTSGNGREGGLFGIEDFLETKAISAPKGWSC